ncbi:tetratricopeptide repeat protein [Corticicoccus populi]|uniref:Tetratricopeptide repeat protein n=1 Tax=Corticicoccus populi TaxID=1812821 RepID=A0ABW5WS97_9STAP
MEGLEQHLQAAIDLRKKGSGEESTQRMLSLLKDYDDSPELNYHIAVNFDSTGYTWDAIPFYEKAIELDLSSTDLEGCILGLGSSYRLTGQYEYAVSVLRKGYKKFPENRAIQTFYAIALYNNQEFKEAMQVTLNNLLDTTNDSNISQYNKPLKYYTSYIDDTWNPEQYSYDKKDEF